MLKLQPLSTVPLRSPFTRVINFHQGNSFQCNLEESDVVKSKLFTSCICVFFIFFICRNMPGPSAPSSVLNIRMTNILMLLRKCCNHPYLLECPLEEGTLLRKVDEDMVNCSGKMLLLDRMLPLLKERGHKVHCKAI